MVALREVYLFHLKFSESSKVGYSYGRAGTTALPAAIIQDGSGTATVQLCEAPGRARGRRASGQGTRGTPSGCQSQHRQTLPTPALPFP